MKKNELDIEIKKHLLKYEDGLSEHYKPEYYRNNRTSLIQVIRDFANVVLTKRPEMFICSRCNKKVNSINENNLCEDCSKIQGLTCAKCGNPTDNNTGYIICSDCFKNDLNKLSTL